MPGAIIADALYFFINTRKYGWLNNMQPVVSC